MRRKYRRSLLSVAFASIYSLVTLLLPCQAFAAASGNYTDLLPIGAAGNTTVISNGSGWSLTTLPPTQTFGDSLSRVVDAVYQSSSTVTFANTTAVSTFTNVAGQGYVGSTTFPASWVASGRTIRVTVAGRYSTTAVAPTWTWAVLMGTTSVLSTGAVSAVGNQTGQWFKAEALITVNATGASGTASGVYSIFTSSSTTGTATLCFSTSTASAVTVNWLTQLTVNPTFTWGTQSNSNTITANNVVVEFLN